MQVPTLPHVFAFQSDVSLNARIASSLTTLRRRTSSFGPLLGHAANALREGVEKRATKIHRRRNSPILDPLHLPRSILTSIKHPAREIDPRYQLSLDRPAALSFFVFTSSYFSLLLFISSYFPLFLFTSCSFLFSTLYPIFTKFYERFMSERSVHG